MRADSRRGDVLHSFAIARRRSPAFVVSFAAAALLWPTLALGADTPPAFTSPPAVQGDAVVGATLTATATWTGDPAPTVKYQWRRCPATGGSCDPIAGATAAKYVVATADLGFRLGVRITLKNTVDSINQQSVTTAVVVAASHAARRRLRRRRRLRLRLRPRRARPDARSELRRRRPASPSRWRRSWTSRRAPRCCGPSRSCASAATSSTVACASRCCRSTRRAPRTSRRAAWAGLPRAHGLGGERTRAAAGLRALPAGRHRPAGARHQRGAHRQVRELRHPRALGSIAQATSA